MNPSHSFKALLSLVLLGGLGSACSLDASTSPSETESTAAALEVACPATAALRGARQQQATKILASILGDSTVALPYMVRIWADTLRKSLIPKVGYGTSTVATAYLTVDGAGEGSVCGIPTGFVRFGTYKDPYLSASGYNQILTSQLTNFKQLAAEAEKEWPGITPFLHTSNCVYSTYSTPASEKCTLEFDPEPAQLSAPLSGSSGAAAAAAYVTSGSAVSVREWPTSYTSCSSNCPSAGQPCTPSNLSAGAKTSTVIMRDAASPTRYRCVAPE